MRQPSLLRHAVVAPIGGVLLCGRCAQRRAKTWRAFFAALEGLRERSSNTLFRSLAF